MGEIANDLINGLSCEGCGVYFTEAHGYPVRCETCWEPGTKRAVYDEI